MRPRIVGLDVDAMDWAPLGPPGLFSKLLSRDPETGARTALQRMDPALGYQAPTIAHFHTTYEEILGIDGRFSFDSKLWVVPGAYVFHPPRTVHGFKSTVPQESLFLSRVGRDLDVNLVPEPAGDQLYVVEGPAPARSPAAYGDAVGALGWKPANLLGRAVSCCVLSTDPETGEGSALVELPSGWTSDAQARSDYLEIFVLTGNVEFGKIPVSSGRAYSFFPPQAGIPTLRAVAASRLYVNFGRAL
ncbi:hypothetical protein B0I00_2190 [Novosphingobium kunmingense]|uniref:ChrR-like cupin domain-containing protein n=1 Tax=Novosphingobium kunmingense TaxID=1211806 RepID=A0A2N0H6L9_9SPHN|nr:hypothetical protein [Novosphingobium kunmingense]PKB14593.1 hypothetical protein B0I00_2190 [Novosphingobium kunmingense]